LYAVICPFHRSETVRVLWKRVLCSAPSRQPRHGCLKWNRTVGRSRDLGRQQS